MSSKFTHLFSLIKQSLRGGEQDYTSGSLRIAIVLLAVPMMLELSLESVFAVVDIYFVNRISDDEKTVADAVAVVGLTEMALTIIYSIGIGLSAAATALVARRIGEKNPEAATRASAQTLLLSAAVIIAISIPGYVFAADILRLMGAEESAIEYGAGFTRIMMGGSGVIVLLFMINGIFRGAGNAGIAMRSLWLASGINIILCPLLIFGPGPFPAWGIEGAAIATTIGRGTGVLYQLYFLFRVNRGIIHIRSIHWKPDWSILKSLAGIGWPATFQFCIMSASWIVLGTIVAQSGSEASAGFQTAIRLFIFFLLPAWGLSNAAATLVGQNLGAKQPERAEQSVKLIAIYNAVFMGVVMVFFLVFAKPLCAFFIENTSGEQYRIAVQALRIVSAGYIFYGVGMVYMQAFNGAGDTKTPQWISFVGFWLFQIPLAMILAWQIDLGPLGVFIAVPVAETFITMAYWYFFKKGKWKTISV